MPDRPQRSNSRRRVSNWVRYFGPMLRPDRARLSWAVAAMVLDALLTALRPWPLKVVIDCVLSNHPTRVPWLGPLLAAKVYDRQLVLLGACTATLLIAVSTGLLTFYFTRAMGNAAQRFVLELRCRLFAHMQRLSLRFHDRHRTGDLITRITSDVGAIQDVLANGSILLFSNACLLLAMLGMMLWLNWRFALAALAVAPLLFIVVFRYTRRIKVAARAARMSDGLLASVAQETVASLRIVQCLAQEDRQDARFRAQGEVSLEANLVGIRHQARVAPIVDALAAVGLATVMGYGATQVLAGKITTGDMVIFFAYVTNFYSPMKALARISSSWNKAEVGAERIVEVIETGSEVRDRPDARVMGRATGAIEFRDVMFEYAPGRPVLSGINLVLREREKVALVGATGAGKSTLISLIPRLFDPSSGAVLMNGQDLRNFQLQSLRENVSMVLQESLLFSGTIRENIVFGRPGACEADIVAAAKIANAHPFITQLAEGYDTRVAERGATLSGGQKQRIAIARAVLRDAPILILDEPTSGLDAHSEHTVIQALETASVGRTTIIIAHHLSATRLADRVVFLEDGRIVEDGTHAELVSRGGAYSRLFHLQLSTLGLREQCQDGMGASKT